MLEGYIRYSITDEEVFSVFGRLGGEEKRKIISSLTLWEVWEGIPFEYHFKEAKSRGGEPAWRAETKDVYIWVTPSARQALEGNGQAVLMVMAGRAGKKLEADVTFPTQEGMTLNKAIEHAQKLNIGELKREKKKRDEKKKREEKEREEEEKKTKKENKKKNKKNKD